MHCRCPHAFTHHSRGIHTDKIEKRSENGWGRFNADEQMDGLMQSITPRLTSHASSDSHLNLVREHARKTVAEFVRQWLMKEDHWRETGFGRLP